MLNLERLDSFRAKVSRGIGGGGTVLLPTYGGFESQ
jgi:hypothetical protein